MTAIPKDIRVNELREMFRFLLTFRTLYETCGTDEIVNSYGNSWSLWDLEYLYDQTKHLKLPQQRAITLCLVHGFLERDAATAMEVGENNPVGMYASLGLRRLLDKLDEGELDRYRERPRSRWDKATDRDEFVANLAAFIRSKVVVTDGHWLFPSPPHRAPGVVVRSRASSSGFLSLHPRVVLYEEQHGAVHPDFRLAHREDEGPCPECVKPLHTEAVLTEAARERLRAQVRRASLRSTA